MKLHHIPILALCLASSCEKAKKLAEQATSTVKERMAEGGETPVDPELQKLVDQTDEGVVFRKDLPFPAHIRVNSTTSNQLTLRLFENSAIERKSGMLNGVMESTDQIELAGDRLQYKPGKVRFTDPSVKDSDGKAKEITEPPLKTASPPRGFHRRDGKWHADEGGGFAVAATSRDIAPFIDVLMRENALAPRPQWFAKRRLNLGGEVVLTGEALSMLIGGGATGTLNLKLESIGAVAGHPCGVFSVTGDYSRRQFPSFSGGFTDEDVTIQSGKVWLSLIHPLVLKWEMDTIQSFKTGEKGGLQLQAQGTSKVSTTLEWKVTERGL